MLSCIALRGSYKHLSWAYFCAFGSTFKVIHNAIVNVSCFILQKSTQSLYIQLDICSLFTHLATPCSNTIGMQFLVSRIAIGLRLDCGLQKDCHIFLANFKSENMRDGFANFAQKILKLTHLQIAFESFWNPNKMLFSWISTINQSDMLAGYILIYYTRFLLYGVPDCILRMRPAVICGSLLIYVPADGCYFWI